MQVAHHTSSRFFAHGDGICVQQLHWIHSVPIIELICDVNVKVRLTDDILPVTSSTTLAVTAAVVAE